ncbi:MAG TPA: MerR family transcriptional regulator [Oceanobacillus sp.]|nr:MerR family transcriptional regulator [Oceanobacillus sp.]
MFKIGDFSRISQVSIRSLRHYDEIGLFKPAYTDPFTGYRYYTADQLPRLNRIVALKSLGLSLDEVALLVNDDLSVEVIRGMFKLRQSQLRRHILEVESQLKAVEMRLKQIETEGTLPETEPVIKRLPEQSIISIREIAPTLRSMGDLLMSMHTVVRHQAKEAGYGVAVFYDWYYDDIDSDWELGFAVPETFDRTVRLEDGRTLTMHVLPAVEQMACVTYEGNYFGLSQGYSQLGVWLDERGYRICGEARELFLHIGDADHQDENVTEIQFPVEQIPTTPQGE